MHGYEKYASTPINPHYSKIMDILSKKETVI